MPTELCAIKGGPACRDIGWLVRRKPDRPRHLARANNRRTASAKRDGSLIVAPTRPVCGVCVWGPANHARREPNTLIADFRREGVSSVSAIARALTARGIPRPGGQATWSPVQ